MRSATFLSYCLCDSLVKSRSSGPTSIADCCLLVFGLLVCVVHLTCVQNITNKPQSNNKQQTNIPTQTTNQEQQARQNKTNRKTDRGFERVSFLTARIFWEIRSRCRCALEFSTHKRGLFRWRHSVCSVWFVGLLVCWRCCLVCVLLLLFVCYV